MLEAIQRETWQDLDPGRKTDEDRKTPVTWVFETREGGRGILQVLEYSGQGVNVRYKLIQNSEANATPNPNPLQASSVFGLQAERDITTNDDDNQGLVFYKFKNNDIVKPPFPLKLHLDQAPAFVELTPELQQWIKANEVDVLFHFGEKSWEMMALEMQEDYAGQPTDWKTIPPDRAMQVFAKKDADGLMRSEVPSSSGGHGYRDGWDYVNAFRTRSNTIGIYQLRGIDDVSGRGVQIRTKLVQTSTAATK
jgi:hypothetical protein